MREPQHQNLWNNNALEESKFIHRLRPLRGQRIKIWCMGMINPLIYYAHTSETGGFGSNKLPIVDNFLLFHIIVSTNS